MENTQFLLDQGILTQEQIDVIDWNVIASGRVNKEEFYRAISINNRRFFTDRDLTIFARDCQYLVSFLYEGAPKSFVDIITRSELRAEFEPADRKKSKYYENDVKLNMLEICDSIEDGFSGESLKLALEEMGMDQKDPYVDEIAKSLLSDEKAKKQIGRFKQQLDTIELVSENKEKIMLGLAMRILEAQRTMNSQEISSDCEYIEPWKLKAMVVKYMGAMSPIIVNNQGQNEDENPSA
ncbi:MAG: hypothetical protein IJW59_00240 [Clostridia bacterium]|nr:hypothetical protein [Clostridia bacterium]